MQIFISSAECYQPIIVIKKRGSQIDHNKRLPLYLLTAIVLPPGGSSTLHIYTQTINRTIKNPQYIEQHNNFGRVRTVPCIG